jgi:hypothetical protein
MIGLMNGSQEAESRLRAAGLTLPAVTDSDLDQQRSTALPEPFSGTSESADPSFYEMVGLTGP